MIEVIIADGATMADLEPYRVALNRLADRVQAIADGAVELAWVQTPGASISPVSAEEAVRHLDALLSRPEARSAGDALAHVVRSDAAERRGNERVA